MDRVLLDAANGELSAGATSATVVFNMWGQRCETGFSPESELNPVEWVMRCWDHGWLEPIEIRVGLVVITKDELTPAFNAYQNGQRVGRIWKIDL